MEVISDRIQVWLVLSKEDTKIPEKENQQDKQAEQSIDEKIKKMIEEQFPDTLIENSDSDHIQIKPEK